jgi:hypothetical protein
MRRFAPAKKINEIGHKLLNIHKIKHFHLIAKFIKDLNLFLEAEKISNTLVWDYVRKI